MLNHIGCLWALSYLLNRSFIILVVKKLHHIGYTKAYPIGSIESSTYWLYRSFILLVVYELHHISLLGALSHELYRRFIISVLQNGHHRSFIILVVYELHHISLLGALSHELYRSFIISVLQNGHHIGCTETSPYWMYKSFIILVV